VDPTAALGDTAKGPGAWRFWRTSGSRNRGTVEVRLLDGVAVGEGSTRLAELIGHMDKFAVSWERGVSRRGDLPVKRSPQNVRGLLVEREDRCQGRELSHAGENDADPIAMAC
jgi:hypothetical protein